MSQTEAIDGRRARGDVTRHTVARAAARAATVEGLDSITVGGLAAITGVSKSGILTVFGTREAIQIAAVAEARRLYQEWVVLPAWDESAGAERLTSLIEHWVAYTKADVFPGGCFVAATSVEFGHRDGPVAESVQRLKREWLDLSGSGAEDRRLEGAGRRRLPDRQLPLHGQYPVAALWRSVRDRPRRPAGPGRSSSPSLSRWVAESRRPSFVSGRGGSTSSSMGSTSRTCGLSTSRRRLTFPRIVDLIASVNTEESASPAVRFLFAARWKLGEWLGWDDEDAGVDSRVPSLRDRLPAELAATVDPGRFLALPFTPLYELPNEFAAEIANKTMHGILHLGAVPAGNDEVLVRMTVLVKTNGLFGRAYMAAIKPFRYLFVYPAMFRELEGRWAREQVP